MKKLTLHCVFTIVAAGFGLPRISAAQNIGFSSQVLPNRDVKATPAATTTLTQPRNGQNPALPREELTTSLPSAAIIGPETATVTGRSIGRLGILADGSFSSALTASSGAVPTVGALGLNFIVLQPVTYSNTYRYRVKESLGQAPSAARDSSLHIVPDETRLQTKFSLNAYGAFGSLGDTLQVNSKGGQILNQTNFGQVLLQPGVYTRGFRSAGISIQSYPFYWWEHYLGLRRLGFTAEGVVTSTRWSYQQQRAGVVIWAMAGGLNYVVFDSPAVSSDEISGRMELYAKYSLRQISGDVRDTPIILEQALGPVSRYWFHGVEFGSRIAINNLRLSASYFQFGDHIEGFSNGQFVLSVGFSGAIRFKELKL
jgi:hypothetical protein